MASETDCKNISWQVYGAILLKTRKFSKYLIPAICLAILLPCSTFIFPHSGGLSDTELKFFQQNGYLIIRGMFSEKELQIMQEDTHKAIEHAKHLTSNLSTSPLNEYKVTYRGDEIRVLDNNAQYVFDKNTYSIKRVVWVGGHFPRLLDLGQNKRLLEPVASILGTKEADHLINQLHPKLPDDGVEFIFHRDIENRKNFDRKWSGESMKNGGFVQTFLALDEMGEDNGGIEIYPRTHHESTPLKNSSKTQNEIRDELRVQGYTPVFERLKPGDVLFFHPNIVHRSLPNKSGHHRRAMINGFSAPGANHAQYPGNGSSQRISLKK